MFFKEYQDQNCKYFKEYFVKDYHSQIREFFKQSRDFLKIFVRDSRGFSKDYFFLNYILFIYSPRIIRAIGFLYGLSGMYSLIIKSELSVFLNIIFWRTIRIFLKKIILKTILIGYFFLKKKYCFTDNQDFLKNIFNDSFTRNVRILKDYF